MDFGFSHHTLGRGLDLLRQVGDERAPGDCRPESDLGPVPLDGYFLNHPHLDDIYAGFWVDDAPKFFLYLLGFVRWQLNQLLTGFPLEVFLKQRVSRLWRDYALLGDN